LEFTDYIRYHQHQKLTGVLYLRDIHEKKMKGGEKRNIDLFLSLCGKKYLTNVLLVTTKWDDHSEVIEEVEKRESQLREKFWACMEELGCGYSKYRNTRDSAIGIIEPMLNLSPDYLQIQEELGAQHLPLRETAAGQIVHDGLAKDLAELRQKMKENKKQMEEAHHEAMRKALRNQQDNIAMSFARIEARNRILEEDYEKLLEKAENPRAMSLLKKWERKIDKKLPGDITTKAVIGGGVAGVSFAVGVAAAAAKLL
jgi:hypothetical protein